VARSRRYRERSGGVPADVERARAVPIRFFFLARERPPRLCPLSLHDALPISCAGGALVADVVGELFAVLVAVAVDDGCVVAAGEGGGGQAGGEVVVSSVVEGCVGAFEDAGGVVDAGAGAVVAAVLGDRHGAGG